MGSISWWHWLIVGGAFVLLFGAKKLPDAARGLGRSLRILKSEVAAMDSDQLATTDQGNRSIAADSAAPPSQSATNP